MRAVLAGDALALDRWYRREHPEVWRLCVGFLADAAEAEDVAQDAMLKLHDELPRWDAALCATEKQYQCSRKSCRHRSAQ